MKRSARIATAKALLIEYGATMTLEQFKAAFFPNLVTKTIRNKVSSGDLPMMRNDVFDTQEVGEWWDSYAPSVDESPSHALPVFAPEQFAGLVANALASPIRLDQPVVYLLIDAGAVVYVGKSIQHLRRVPAHLREAVKTFDSYAMIRCDPEMVSALEAQLIALLRPKYNIAGVSRED